MTLEQKYHVRPEPANTCPIIDAAISSATDDLNKIRAENEAIREWGDRWKTIADDLSDELGALRDSTDETIAKLESDVASLEKELANVRSELETAYEDLRGERFAQ